MPSKLPAKIPPARLKPLTEAEMTPRQHESPPNAALARQRRDRRTVRRVPARAGLWRPRPEARRALPLSTAVPPRLSEFAILVLARLWRAQYEWYAHAPIAEKAGVTPKTIKDLQAGRAPTSAPKDERALYDFISELHKTKRVSDKTYKRVHALLGDAAMVEFAGILGYYTLIAMTLNVFRVPLPDGERYRFKERSLGLADANFVVF